MDVLTQAKSEQLSDEPRVKVEDDETIPISDSEAFGPIQQAKVRKSLDAATLEGTYDGEVSLHIPIRELSQNPAKIMKVLQEKEDISRECEKAAIQNIEAQKNFKSLESNYNHLAERNSRAEDKVHECSL